MQRFHTKQVRPPGSAVQAYATAWAPLRWLRSRYFALALVAIMLGGAFARLHGLSDALVSFNNTRQLHCAIITRATYFDWIKPATDSRRVVADRASGRRGKLEPAIVPTVVAFGYYVTGGEHFVIVRLLGITFWLIAAAALFAFVRALTSPVAALFAVGYFLLLPFSVIASQSFQPDPLMILLMIASFYAIVRNDRQPSLPLALLTGATCGVAVLVKPVCGPVIVVLYAALALRRLGVRVMLRLESWLVATLLAVPSALYYVREMLNGGRLRSQAAGSFMPEYWDRPEFFSGWRDTLLRVVGGPYIVGLALLGVALAPRGRTRVALWALVIGYVGYGFAFPYHISTHDYYHLQLVPIIGLSLATLFQRLYSASVWRAKVPVGLSAAACALAFTYAAAQEIERETWPRTHGENGRDQRYLEIGALVNHNTRVVFLDPNKYGSELEFEGEISGWLWPSGADLRRGRRRGLPPLDWRALFDQRIGEGAEFFVGVPAQELRNQPRLFSYLSAHHPLISASPEYLVYDLRVRR